MLLVLNPHTGGIAVFTNENLHARHHRSGRLEVNQKKRRPGRGWVDRNPDRPKPAK